MQPRFSQDRTCVATVRPGAAGAAAVHHCDPFGISWTAREDQQAVLVEQLFSTSLIAIVDAGDTQSVRIINTKTGRDICPLQFAEDVRDVRMNRKRLVVLLQSQLHIFDMSSMKLLKKINTSGTLCDLSIGDESILAYQREGAADASNTTSDGLNTDSTNRHVGDVVVYDTINLTPISIINCHVAPIVNLVLNRNGNLLATASTKGTLIRLFNTRTGIRLYEYRRGSLPTFITSIVFNSEDSIVACVSSSGSIHVFTLPTTVTELATLSVLPQSTTDKTDSTPISNQFTDIPQTQLVTNAESDEIHRLLSNVAKSSFTNKLWNSSKQYINLPKSATPTLKQPHVIIRLPQKGSSAITIVNNTCWAATQSTLYRYTLPANNSAPVLQATHPLN